MIGAGCVPILKKEEKVVQCQFEMRFGQEIVGVKEEGDGNRAALSPHVSEIAATARRH